MAPDPRAIVGDWLADPENADANWLLGDLLRARLALPDWLDNTLLLVIALRHGVGLRDLARDFRACVGDDPSVTGKRDRELNANNLDQQIEDFLAELMAVVYLAKHGFTGFRFLVASAQPTPDLTAVRDETDYLIEVKNLRGPTSPTNVAFARWHRKRVEEPDRFSFTVELDFQSSVEPDLSTKQVEELRRVVEMLPEKSRPAEFVSQLQGGIELRFKVYDGPPGMMAYGQGGLLDEVMEPWQTSFLVKALEKTQKGLRQLYASHLPKNLGRVLFLRWGVPTNAWLVADAIRSQVRDSLTDLLQPYFPKLEVHILNSTDNL